MKYRIVFLCIIMIQSAFAQEDSLFVENLKQVVVTATRSERQLGSLPMAMTLVGKKEIQQMGSMRLSEVLAEQTGLFVVEDHGKGIQLQGFNPDYTLILVDGEPLIGRTAGTLELSRLAVGNIKQIEIVKGPSSSLYGSEALAGVINIITEQPNRTGANFSLRYGSNQTSDLSANAYLKKDKFSMSLFANRYSSGGYDLSPETFGKTVSPFVSYTLQPKINYSFSKSTKLKISGRWFTESQEDIYETIITSDTVKIAGEGQVNDKNLNISFNHKMKNGLNLITRFYTSKYATESELINQNNDSLYDSSYFTQSFLRPELLADFNLTEKHFFLFGAGLVHETVEATRYDDLKKFNTKYAFVQYEYFASDKFQLIIGGRYDAHSAYSNQFSPKLATLFKVNKQLKLRASFGMGYKAPDFRQLYLNFTNPVAGYSVFGSHELVYNLEKLHSRGEITNVFIDPNTFGELNPESSIANNVGLLYTPNFGGTLSLNLFRNDVNDLIESFPVAEKTNGQNVYSYRNISQVYTQGIEIDLSKPFHVGYKDKFTIKAGYQFLDAKDKAVLAKIDDGKLYRRDPETLETVRVSRKEYGGLINRSKHSANIKLYYETQNRFNINLRAIYRGRYGFNDLNGNEVIDIDEEYVKGFMLLNATVSKSLKKWTGQMGIDNILDYTNPKYQPGQSGRQIWGRILLDF